MLRQEPKKANALGRNEGFTIIGVIVGTLILVITFFAVASSMSQRQRQVNLMSERAIAEAFAAELLEIFRSMATADLVTYLKATPSVPSNIPIGSNPYPLCAHINLLDRVDSTPTSPVIINGDPNADLGTTSLDAGPGGLMANRYYQVTVINPVTMVFSNGLCTTSITAPATGYSFFVTVGVSWVPKGKTIADAQQVTLSTIIPN